LMLLVVQFKMITTSQAWDVFVVVFESSTSIL
jgi:hypothetical protein